VEFPSSRRGFDSRHPFHYKSPVKSHSVPWSSVVPKIGVLYTCHYPRGREHRPSCRPFIILVVRLSAVRFDQTAESVCDYRVTEWRRWSSSAAVWARLTRRFLPAKGLFRPRQGGKQRFLQNRGHVERQGGYGECPAHWRSELRRCQRGVARIKPAASRVVQRLHRGGSSRRWSRPSAMARSRGSRRGGRSARRGLNCCISDRPTLSRSTCWPRSHAADVRMPDLLRFSKCLRGLGLPFRSGAWRGRPSP
jgi:hypothetical protein